MPRKNVRNTKGKIVSAAWKLFYEQGYDNTTVEEIIAESGTSKGSFYHYFEGKDALLETLSILFDEKYEELQGVAEAMDAVAVCICLFAHVSSYFHILLWGCVFVAVYAFFLWFFGLNKFERDLVAVPASKIWRRIRRR